MAFFDIFNFGRKSKDSLKEPETDLDIKRVLISSDDPELEDIEDDTIGGVNSFNIELTIQESNIKKRILQYRSAALSYELDEAIDEIIGDAIVQDKGEIVRLNLDNSDYSENVKKLINEEFKNILRKMNFRKMALTYFKFWYIDGRIYFFTMPHKNEKEGIDFIKMIDPLTLFRLKKKGKIYYKYKPKEKDLRFREFFSRTDMYLIPEEYISFAHSGITDAKKETYLSHIQKAIKPLNQLNLLEDAAVTYRVTRAVERRVFYIDVGKLPKKKAEAYVTKLMTKFRSKVTYDVVSGTVNQKKGVMSMIEDFYLPTRSDGSKGTKVETLPSGTQLGEITDLLYFKRKLYKSMKIPLSRTDEESANINFNDTGNLTQETLKFARFIDSLHMFFEPSLIDILKKQLLYKNIINLDESNNFDSDIFLKWSSDLYIDQLKENEVLQTQIDIADSLTEYVGKYFSHTYIRKNVFQQTDKDIEEMNKEIELEKKDKNYQLDDEE